MPDRSPTEIAQREAQHAVLQLRRQLDRGARRRVLGRVGQQVRQHLHQTPLITLDRKTGHRLDDLEGDLKYRAVGPVFRHGVFKQGAGRQARPPEWHRPRLDLLHVERIVDERFQPLAVAVGHIQQLVHLITDTCWQIAP